MWFQPRSTTAHQGTAPAAAMPTPFSFPCGPNFHKDTYQKEKEVRDQCAPPAWDQYWWSSVGYYSPAVCPSGYTAGCLRWDNRQGPPVEPTETAVQCVPSGFMCANRDISNAVSYTSTVPMIQVRWAESDLTLLATHPLQPGADAAHYHVTAAPMAMTKNAQAVIARQLDSFSPDDNNSTVPSSPQGTSGSSGSSGNQNDGSSGLSSGAKAGIGIGVALGSLIVAGAIAFFIWKSRRASSNNGLEPAPVPAPASGGPHFGTSELSPANYQGHLYEMPGNNKTASPTVVGSEMLPTPPPPAVLSPEKNEKAELPAQTSSPRTLLSSELDAGNMRNSYPRVPELYSEGKPLYTELPTDSRPAEIDSTQQVSSSSPIPRKQVGNPDQQVSSASQTPTSPRNDAVGPDTGVSIMPGMHAVATPPSAQAQAPFVTEPSAEPSPQEIAALLEQHAQLEERRQRILELERIEREQAALQQKLHSIRGDGQTPGP